MRDILLDWLLAPGMGLFEFTSLTLKHVVRTPYTLSLLLSLPYTLLLPYNLTLPYTPSLSYTLSLFFSLSLSRSRSRPLSLSRALSRALPLSLFLLLPLSTCLAAPPPPSLHRGVSRIRPPTPPPPKTGDLYPTGVLRP